MTLKAPNVVENGWKRKNEEGGERMKVPKGRQKLRSL